MKMNPITPFLDVQGYMILDGGLSTQLESRGYNLDHPLWTARMLVENPDAIKAAHLEFLEAGADCIISSSYQASVAGLTENGYSQSQAIDLITTSYLLALECCDEFYASLTDKTQRLKPIVAASIGPYGAYLADGSEYHGNYGLSEDALISFHRPRFDLLAQLSNLLAIETIPSLREAKVLCKLLSDSDCCAWVSFSCKNGEQINDGHRIEEAVSLVEQCQNVVAIGVNCTAPLFISPLIEKIKASCGNKPIAVYPNSGERFCPQTKTWAPGNGNADSVNLAPEWVKHGAELIGGCCRVRADDIRRLRMKMDES